MTVFNRADSHAGSVRDGCPLAVHMRCLSGGLVCTGPGTRRAPADPFDCGPNRVVRPCADVGRHSIIVEGGDTVTWIQIEKTRRAVTHAARLRQRELRSRGEGSI